MSLEIDIRFSPGVDLLFLGLLPDETGQSVVAIYTGVRLAQPPI
jgi:hypothetical protein